jgi:hypothetical protein
MSIINFGIIMLIGDEVVAVRFHTVMQAFDLIWLGGILFIYRPRVWPSFFTVGIADIGSVSIKSNN